MNILPAKIYFRKSTRGWHVFIAIDRGEPLKEYCGLCSPKELPNEEKAILYALAYTRSRKDLNITINYTGLIDGKGLSKEHIIADLFHTTLWNFYVRRFNIDTLVTKKIGEGVNFHDYNKAKKMFVGTILFLIEDIRKEIKENAK